MESICSSCSILNWRKNFKFLAKGGRESKGLELLKRGVSDRVELVVLVCVNDRIRLSEQGCAYCLKAMSTRSFGTMRWLIFVRKECKMIGATAA